MAVEEVVVGAPFIEFDDVTVSFGSLPVIQPTKLSIEQGKFMALIGPSGCGKTTLLNLMAGVLTPSSGVLRIGGVPRERSDIKAGYLLARDALMPWRTAQKNVELPLEILGVSAKQRHEVAGALLQRVGLGGYENQHVKRLSHGMRQRVSLARILAYDPSVLLLDEPFSALDAQTRTRAQEFFLEVWQRDQKTVLLVTHDIQEALFMADEILVFSGRPAKVLRRITVDFDRPRSLEELRVNPDFLKYYDEIWTLLRDNVQY